MGGMVEEIELDDNWDADDLARELLKTKKEKAELKLYEDFLVERLAQLAIDQPLKTIETAYGRFKARWASPTRKWERDAVSQEVYNLARRGELHEPNKDGELPGTQEWRIFDALKTVFRFEPRISEIKKINLDPDEYSKVEGTGHWTVQTLSEPA